MARLQRKKTSSKKKKRKPGIDKDLSVTQESGIIEKKSIMPGSPEKEAKKRQTSTQQKTMSIARISQGKENFLQKGIQFLREVKVELKKVTWPSRKQTIGSTVVVIILVLIVSLFLGVVDIGLSNLVRVVLQKDFGG